MSLRVVFRPEAEDDLLTTRDFYESRRAGLGKAFGREIESLIARISDAPRSFPTVHAETQRAVLSRFPYAIYFRVESETVVVLAVHGRQHPQHWQLRR
jgi:plasmid stabilization system protein ParE